MDEATEFNRIKQFLGTHLTELAFGLIGLAFLVDLLRRLLIGQTGLSTVMTFLWEGLIFGLMIGLAGIGLAMTYSILKFANFAHGDLLTAGAFSGWSTTFVLAGFGEFSLETLILVGDPATITSDIKIAITTAPIEIFIGLVVSAILTALLALVIDRIVFRPIRDQSGIALLIASVGVALALRHLIQVFYRPGSPALTYGPAIPSFSIPVGAETVIIGGHQIVVGVVAVLLMIGVHVLLQYTKLGTAMRAMADNEDLARITGISTERIVTYTWLIGGGLTGAAGYLLALEIGVLNLTLGWDLLLLIFSAVILGGIGSVYGAMAGGLVIGLVSQLSIVWVPTEFSTVAAFVILIAILLVRPSGIFRGVTSV